MLLHSNIDQRRACGLLYLDLKKAFDTVDHYILINKLKTIGVKNKNLNRFESYLQVPTQVTKVGQSSSGQRLVTCGVPQGSVLGPLLFSLYVNDLPMAIPTAQTHLYADDTAVTITGISIKQIKAQLNTTINSLSKWFAYNRLSLNSVKSKATIFSTQASLAKMSTIHITVGQHCLERVDEYKYLGVKLDIALSFTVNTAYIQSKIVARIGALGRARQLLDESTCLYIENWYYL